MTSTVEERQQFYSSLCDLQIPNSISFSPDAKHVLYSTGLTWNHKTAKYPVSTLWLAKTGTPNSARKITPGDHNDHSPRWSPDGKSIAFVSDRAEAGKKWAVYLLNVQISTVSGDIRPLSGEFRPLTAVENESEIEALEFAPDGKSLAYISANEKSAEYKTRAESELGGDPQVWGEQWTNSHLRLLDLATNEVQRLEIGNRHVKALSWSPEGDKLALMNAQTPDIEEAFLTGATVSILDMRSRKVQDVCTIMNDVEDLTFAGDGQLYFRTGSSLDKACSGQSLYTAKAEPNAKVEKVAGFGIENDVVGVQRVGGEVLVHLQQGLEDCIALSEGRVVWRKAREVEAFAAAYTLDSDEIVLAVATSDIDHPVEVYTTTASGGGLVQLSSHGVAFKDVHFGTCTILKTPSIDDETLMIESLLLKPPKASAGAQPTIVLIHGGPDSRHSVSFNTHYYFWTPYLLHLGYTLLLPNYRGSLGRGHAFVSHNFAPGPGHQDYDDIIAATANAIREGHSDPERLLVAGLSQGGFLSYTCAVRNGLHDQGWKFRAAIPVSGTTDADSLFLTSDLGSSIELELSGGRAPWLSSQDQTRNRDASPLWQVQAACQRAQETGEMTIPPMLIIHGEQDPRCPLSGAVGMRRALIAWKLPFEMVVYPRQGHLFKERGFWVDMMGRVERFVEMHIGKGSV